MTVYSDRIALFNARTVGPLAFVPRFRSAVGPLALVSVTVRLVVLAGDFLHFQGRFSWR